MAQQITPLAPGLPATTAIQDPAVRQFANAVADILRTSQTTEGAVALLSRAAGALSKGGGGSAPPAISQWLYSSELYQRLSSAIERVDTSAQEAIVAEALARAQAITIEQENRASAIAAEASARFDAIFAEAQLRAEAINAEAAARIQAIAAEREDRAAELAAERAERIQALIDEAVARQAAISAEASARAAAILAESENRASALAAEAAAREAETLARIQAINAEAAARIAALLQERGDRIAAISAEHDAWVSAIAAEALARGTAISVETVARQEADLALASQITTLSAVVDGNVSAIQSEVTARTTADEALAQQLTTLVGVVGDNTAAIQAETTARTTADSALAQQITTLSATVGENDGAARALINAESSARASADAAIAQQITTLSAAVGENASSIQTEQTTRSNQYESLAQQITLISAGVGEQFDFKKIWYFDDGLEGWSGNGEPIVSGGWLRPANRSAAPYVQSPDALAVSANTYRQVRLRIRKRGSPTWAGALWWRRSVDSDWSVSRSMSLDEPTYDGNGIGLISVSVAWSDVIDQVRIELSEEQADTDYFAIDWLAIGRPSPGASTAALYEESLARALADSALASSISSLSASVTSNYGTLSAAINNESSARADADSAIAQQITTLTATVSGNDSDTRALIFEESVARADADGALASQVDALSAVVETNDSAVRALVSGEATARADADGALAQQITTLSATVTENDLAVRALVQTESTARSSADEALAQQITTLTADYQAADEDTLAGAAALVSSEATARASADGALASQIDILSAVVQGNDTEARALIQSESEARANADGALASQITTLAANYQAADEDTLASAAALVSTESVARADADSALAQQITTLSGTVSSNDTSVRALISNEASARADADVALAEQITTLSSAFETSDGEVRALISSESVTRADSISALAEQVSLLTAASSGDFQDLIASISTEKAARASADEALAQQIVTVAAALGDDITAAVQTEAAARVTADEALASQITTLTASYQSADAATLESANNYADSAAGSALTAAQAAVQTESEARANADGALASQITTLSGAVETNDADVRSLILDESSARASADGAIAEQVSALSATVTTNDSSLRALVSAESTARADADSATASQVAGLSAAVNDNAAAIENEAAARVNAVAAEAAARNTLAAQMRGSYDGSSLDQVTSGLIYQERLARATAVDGLAQQITMLSAGAGEQFDYHKIWYFDSGAEGWTGNGAPVASAGWIRPSDHASMPYLESPAGIGANGASYTQVRLRVQKLGTPTWAGALWWRLVGDATWDVARRVSIDEPTYDASGIGLVTVNLPWSGSIDRIRVDLSASQTASVGYEVDWLAIGRPAPGASSAALLAESQARAVADAAEVSAREALSTKVTGAANPASLTLGTLASGLLFDERQARSTADSTEVTARQNLAAKITGFTDPAGKSLVDLTAGLIYEERTARATQDTALATSISTLSARVGTAEASIVSEATARANADSALSSQLTALSATVGSNTAAITSEADARANADSALTTQINTVSSVANGRNRTFRQSTAPTGAVNGDIWYDTANNNSIKRWNGSSWVATDNARIATNEAAIVSEATTRANNDTSIVNAVNTMWAITGATNALSQSGNNIVTNWTVAQANYWSSLNAEVFTAGGQTIRAALQQEAATRANADGSLGAQWTLKTDINGYISGFGFASTANNATPTSEFIIRADKFAVVMPGYGDYVPFAVGQFGPMLLDSGGFSVPINDLVSASANPTSFLESFQSGDLTQWTNHDGSGELSVVSASDSLTGGKVLRIGNNSGDDQAWLIHNQNIPFDPSALYRIKFRVRRTAGTGTVYLGVAGVAADGTTWVRANGANSINGQHYVAAANQTPGSSWTEYVGYIKGTAATGQSGTNPPVTAPLKLHQNVRYIRPLIVANYNDVAGITEVDYCSIELMTDAMSWDVISGSGKPEDGATVGAPDGTLVGGVPAANVAAAVTDFNSSNNRNGAAITAPTILTNGTAVDHVAQKDGSVDISFEWGWSGNEGDIDGFLVYARPSTSSSAYTLGTTPAEETVYTVPANKRAFVLFGVAADKYYTFGVQAYRAVDKAINAAGVIKSALVKATGSGENPYRPSSTVAFTGDVTGTISGTSASTLVSTASNALSAAGAAQQDATEALNDLADIAADNKLTPAEKKSVRKEWDAVYAERAGIRAQADSFGITTEKTNYDNDFQALGTYLNGGTAYTIGSTPPSWITDANLATTTTIVGTTFRANWRNLYADRQALLNKIAAEAAKRADWTLTAGKPDDEDLLNTSQPLNKNPDLLGAASGATTAPRWTRGTSGTISSGYVAVGDYNFPIRRDSSAAFYVNVGAGNTGNAYWFSETFAVDETKDHCLSLWARKYNSTGQSRVYYRIRCYDKDGVDLGTISLWSYHSGLTSTTPKLYYKTISASEFPINSTNSQPTAKVRIELYSGYQEGSAMYTRLMLNEGRVPTKNMGVNEVDIDAHLTRNGTSVLANDFVATWNKINSSNILTYMGPSAITEAVIGTAAISTAKIKDGAIVSAKIGDAQIETAHIKNAQITTAKIGDAAVDTLKLADNSVTVSSVAAGSSTSAPISTTLNVPANQTLRVVAIGFLPGRKDSTVYMSHSATVSIDSSALTQTAGGAAYNEVGPIGDSTNTKYAVPPITIVHSANVSGGATGKTVTVSIESTGVGTKRIVAFGMLK